MKNKKEKTLTMAGGAPVVDNQNSITAGERSRTNARCSLTRKISHFCKRKNT
ncbi:hypothetical protein ES704_03673 [subsurface metagenome]|jgi:catalase